MSSTNTSGKTKDRRLTRKRETAKHLEAFEVWYEKDRSCRHASQIVAVPEKTLHEWKEAYGWHDRADKRDQELAAIRERQVIKERAARLEQQRKAGELLRNRGVEYYVKEKVQNGNEARAAIVRGIEIERTIDGLPSYVGRILNASDTELEDIEREIAHRLELERAEEDAGADTGDEDGEVGDGFDSDDTPPSPEAD